MTSEQIERKFDVVWTGRDYLCVFPPPLPKPDLIRVVTPGLMDVTRPFVHGTRKARVLAAMPGTIYELTKRTGIRRATVYTVLGQLRRAGKIEAFKPAEDDDVPRLLIYRVKGQA